MNSKELREKRRNLWEQANGIISRAEGEKRERTAEENQHIDRLHGDIENLTREIERVERHEDMQRQLAASQGTIAGGRQDGPPQDPLNSRTAEQQQEMRQEAFRSWLVYGPAGLTPEQRAVMAESRTNITPEMRALAVGIDTAGGYTIPDQMVARIETAQRAFAGVRNTRATIVRTTSGNDIPMPTSDDTSNEGARLAENTAVGEQDITLGSKMLRAYMYTSKLVRVSLQFLQDTGIAGVEQWLSDRLGERIGRITGKEFITGTGNNMPEGLETGATLGVTAASATAVTYEELIDLEHSVDPAYRTNAEFLVSDGFLKGAKKLKDTNGNPLWVPGIAYREPDMILGYRYAVDMGMPTPATGKITAYFGDFSKFHIRDVATPQLLRLTERYAEYLQVAFLMFSRHDSVQLDAGTRPIKYLKQA